MILVNPVVSGYVRLTIDGVELATHGQCDIKAYIRNYLSNEDNTDQYYFFKSLTAERHDLTREVYKQAMVDMLTHIGGPRG